MTEYSEKEFREAIEQKLGKKVPDHIWGKVMDDLAGEPYGKYDVLETSFIISKYAPELERTRKPRGRKGKKVEERKKVVGLQLLHWKLGWFYLGKYEDINAGAVRDVLKKYREILGFSEPVRLSELKEVLIGLGAKETPPGLKVFYPQRPKRGEHVDVKFLYYRWRDNTVLRSMCETIDSLVNRLDLHPAEALAFLLCDITPLKRSIFPRVYRQGEEITIKVSPNIKPDALAKLYSEVRSEVIRQIRGVKGKTARPRQASERVQKLLDFSFETNLKGEALLRVWNDKYPHWRYGTVHSLNVVISRAAKKELDRMELGIS